MLRLPVVLTAGAVLAAIGIALTWWRIGYSEQVAPVTAVTAVRSAVLVLTMGLAVIGRLHARATGSAASACTSIAAWGLTGVAAIDLWSVAAAGTTAVAARTALLAGAAWWVARGMNGPPIDTTIRPVRDGLVTATVVACGATGTYVAFVGWSLPDRVSHGSLAVVWSVVAGTGLARLVARHRRPATRVNLLIALALTFAASEAFAATAVARALPGRGGATLLVGGVLAVATLAWLRDLADHAVSRRDAVRDAEVRRLRDGDDHHSQARDRSHELRNAVFAVEAAATMLRSPTDDVERNELQSALASGLAHLRRLVQGSAAGTEPIHIRRLAADRAVLARTQGLQVQVSGDGRIRAMASPGPVAQVIDNLLANARRHACGGRRCLVRVRVDQTDSHAIVRVADRGPGVPEDQRERIFAPGVRLHSGDAGDGLGLHIARDLARRQGGEVWVEPGVPRGAVFVVALPLAGAMAVEPTDEGDHRRQVVESLPGRDIASVHASATSGAPPAVEHDHDVGFDGRTVGATQGQVEPATGTPLQDQGHVGMSVQQRPQRVAEQALTGRDRDRGSGRP